MVTDAGAARNHQNGAQAGDGIAGSLSTAPG
jgi:hypothetical protein